MFDLFGAIGKLLGLNNDDEKKRRLQQAQQQQRQQPQTQIPAFTQKFNPTTFNPGLPKIQNVKPMQPLVNSQGKDVSLPPVVPQPAEPTPNFDEQRIKQQRQNAQILKPQVSKGVPFQTAARDVLGGTAKLTNSGLGVIEKTGVNIAGGTQKLFGDQAGGQRTIDEGVRSIDHRLLNKGSGFLGAGGIFNSEQEMRNTSNADALRKVAGTTLQSAGEVLPVGRGINVARRSAPVVQKLLQGAIQGAASGAAANGGSQIVQKGSIDPGELAKSALTGGLVGGGIPIAAEGVRGAVNLANKGANELSNRINEITNQPGYNSQSGFMQVPGRPNQPEIIQPNTQKESSFKSKTVPASENVSNPLKEVVSKAPKTTYNGVTNQQHLEQSLNNLQTQGIDGLTNDVSNRLNAKSGHIDSQTVADTLSAAQALDVRGDPASLDKAAELYDKLSQHLTAAGQTTQAASLILRRSPDGLQLGAYRQLKKAGVDLTPQIREGIKRDILTIKATPEGSQARQDAVSTLLQNVAQTVPQSLVKNLTGVWKAGLLSGVKTQGGNFLSNATFGGLKKASDPLAALIDQTISLGTGKRTKTLTMRGVSSGTVEGIKNGAYTLKTGIDRRNLANTVDKYETQSGINFKNPVVQKVLGDPANLVFRGMQAADQPFYYAALKNNMYDIAKADGLNKGLSGKALSQHMKEFVSNPTQEALQTANNAAEKAVLGNDTFASKAISGLKRGIDNSEFSDAGKQTANAFVDRIAPFTKVPSAFLSRTLDYTPVGAVKTAVSQIAHKKFDQRALSEAISEAGLGTGIIYLGSELANNDLLSGDYPNDPKEQARWKAQGIQPNSVKIGGQWVSLNYLGPTGLLFGAGKNIHDASKTGDNQAIAAAAGVGKGLLGQSFLQGFTGFGNAIQDPGRYGQNLVNSQVSSSVPAWSNDIANITDPYQRQANNPIEAAASRIPGVRQATLKPKQDAFGNDLTQSAGSLNAALNPLKPSTAKDTPLLTELDRLSKAGFSTFPTPNKTIKVDGETVKLTPDQLNKYTKDSGQAIQETWTKLMDSPKYTSMSDEDKSKYLNNAMSDINAVTKKNTLIEIGRQDLADKVKLTGNQKVLEASIKGQSDSSTYNVRTPSKSSTPSASGDTYLDKYNTAKATYESDSKNWSSVTKAKKDKELAKLAVQKDYSNDTVDLYGMSKQDAYNLVTKDPNGKKLVDDVLKYGDVLVSAGLEKTNKFRDKYGNEAIAPKAKSTGGKRGGKKGAKKVPTKGSFNRVASTAAIRKLLQASGKKLA